MVVPSGVGQPPAPLEIGDVLRLRKPHPCGGDLWVVRRLGADIGLTCRTCGRHVMIERRALERRMAAIVERHGPGTDRGDHGAPTPDRTSG